jgi:hypothetical protein
MTLSDLLLLLYAGAVGFVAAGLGASFYKLVTDETARFALGSQSAFGIATGMLFCALTGPAIMARLALAGGGDARLPLGWRIAGIGIAMLWSCCLGLVVLQVVLAFRDGLA